MAGVVLGDHFAFRRLNDRRRDGRDFAPTSLTFASVFGTLTSLGLGSFSSFRRVSEGPAEAARVLLVLHQRSEKVSDHLKNERIEIISSLFVCRGNGSPLPLPSLLSYRKKRVT